MDFRVFTNTNTNRNSCNSIRNFNACTCWCISSIYTELIEIYTNTKTNIFPNMSAKINKRMSSRTFQWSARLMNFIVKIEIFSTTKKEHKVSFLVRCSIIHCHPHLRREFHADQIIPRFWIQIKTNIFLILTDIICNLDNYMFAILTCICFNLDTHDLQFWREH